MSQVPVSAGLRNLLRVDKNALEICDWAYFNLHHLVAFDYRSEVKQQITEGRQQILPQRPKVEDGFVRFNRFYYPNLNHFG